MLNKYYYYRKYKHLIVVFILYYNIINNNITFKKIKINEIDIIVSIINNFSDILF
jgi:hypothetical protein